MTLCKHCGRAIERASDRWETADPMALSEHCHVSPYWVHAPEPEIGEDYADRCEAVAWKRWPDNTEARNAFMEGALWATTTHLEGL